MPKTDEIVVTSVKLRTVKDHKTFRANGVVTLNDSLNCKVSVVEGKDGLFVNYGGKREEYKEKYYSNVWFKNGSESNLKKKLDEAIIAEYQDLTNGNK